MMGGLSETTFVVNQKGCSFVITQNQKNSKIKFQSSCKFSENVCFVKILVVCYENGMNDNKLNENLKKKHGFLNQHGRPYVLHLGG